MFEGNVAPSNTVCAEAGKFCSLETESYNLVNTFRCKLNQGDENKISVLQAQPTQLYIFDELHWRAGLIHRPSSLWSSMESYGRGYILQPPSVWLYATCSLNKCQGTVPEAEQAEAFSVYGAMPGPLKGPGKFWNIDPIWGYILLILATNYAF